MGKRQNLLGVWQQLPLAQRTITLPAGSYSVRVSSNQRGTVVLTGVTVNTATISSVTTTKATLAHSGALTTTDTANLLRALATAILTNATTVSGQRESATDSLTLSYEVCELV